MVSDIHYLLDTNIVSEGSKIAPNQKIARTCNQRYFQGLNLSERRFLIKMRKLQQRRLLSI